MNRKLSGIASQHFMDKIYNGNKLNNWGIILCKEMGVDPLSMEIKSLKKFMKHGLTQDVVKMSFIRYEERRKLKLVMMEEYDTQKHHLSGDK